jgi:uncharacterized protein (TIGR02391 family)
MVRMAFRTKIRPFPQQQLEAIAKILGDTDEGLAGSQIGHALLSCQIPDVDPANTKWKRLYNALVGFQNERHLGNHIIVFIAHVMNPASHTNCPSVFRNWQEKLNKVLALSGMEVGADGKCRRVTKATNLDEAIARANRLKTALERRNVHLNVLTHCHAEILADNYFHAVLEAIKSITTRIRQLSNLDGDGAALVQAALGGSSPNLKINSFATESQCGEQRGFVSLLTGLYGMVRNPVAHEAKIEWSMSEQDALDIMTTISYIHRKLDLAESSKA